MQIELNEFESSMLSELGFIRGEINDLLRDSVKENELYLSNRIRDFERLAIEFAKILTTEITY
jgi:hypothetical protein